MSGMFYVKREAGGEADVDELRVIDKKQTNKKQKQIAKHHYVVKELERWIGQGNRRLSRLVDLRSLHEYNLHPQHGPDGPDCPYRPWCNYTIRLTLSGSSFSRCQKDPVRQNGLANASFPAAPTQPKENSVFSLVFLSRLGSQRATSECRACRKHLCIYSIYTNAFLGCWRRTADETVEICEGRCWHSVPVPEKIEWKANSPPVWIMMSWAWCLDCY